MKKLSRLVLSAYVGPFVLTFFIAMLFLIMQFLWKYVDDLMGKGLEWYVILELLFYASANLVPMALPLAILLSSIMTFGNLGESSELTAMKSAGLSLVRIMRPLIVFLSILCFSAFLFANYLWPVANLKFRSLIYDIQQQKPTLSLAEKSFYNDIPGFSIRIMEKSDDGNSFSDILIYDHNNPNVFYKRTIAAESGNITNTDDGNYLIFNLSNGKIYKEMEPGEVKGFGKKDPHQTIYFRKGKVNFDLAAFKLQRTDMDLFRTHYEMLNMKQLAKMEDSLKNVLNRRQSDFAENLSKRFLIFRIPHDSLAHGNTANWHSLDIYHRKNISETALNLARNTKDFIEGSRSEFRDREDYINRHRIEWHRKITLAVACFILFFIGAPLGAIIRKGGLGTPIVVSTVLFIFFYIISIMGEKIAKSGVVDPFTGMWLSAFILFPISCFLTFKSNNDSKLFDKDFYLRLLRIKRIEKR